MIIMIYLKMLWGKELFANDVRKNLFYNGVGKTDRKLGRLIKHFKSEI